MDKSEVERHKTYEHIIPVSPFETTTVSKSDKNTTISPEESQKLTSNVTSNNKDSIGDSISGSGRIQKGPTKFNRSFKL
jgi:hypothetical protein